MGSILVTPENLKTQAGKVDDEAGKYYTEYTGLLSDVRELTSTDYRGEDANAFREAVESFEPDFKKMKELMNEYAGFLREAAKNYETTQENIKRDMASLKRN